MKQWLHRFTLAGRSAQNIDWPNHFSQCASQCQHEAIRAFYQAGTTSPQTPLHRVRFVTLDFETTGLDPQQDDIVSIGLVPFTLQRIYCREARHWFVRPAQPLAASSVVIHGITHTDLAHAPTFDQVLDEVLQALKNKIVVAHHHSIERKFLQHAAERYLGERLTFPMLDTMQLELAIQNKQSPWWQVLLNKSPSVRLGQSRARYNLPLYPPHHALTDAIATAELLQAQIAHHFCEQSTLEDFWL